MSSAAFTLSVPADERFRGLAANVIRTYLELKGGAAAAVEEFTAAVAKAVDRMASHGSDVEMVVHADGSNVEVRLTCGTQKETLAFPAGGR